MYYNDRNTKHVFDKKVPPENVNCLCIVVIVFDFVWTKTNIYP